jgi:catechol 2,3-dioxygenase-like lactoylglutathione lyase family enzyme
MKRPEFLSVVPMFTVPDVVEAARYYVEVLGFENRGFFGSPPVFAMLGRGPVEIFFNQDPAARGAQRVRAEVAADAYFRVTGLDAIVAQLKERGATIIEGPVTRVYRMRELVVDDCHGLRLVFGEDAS